MEGLVKGLMTGLFFLIFILVIYLVKKIIFLFFKLESIDKKHDYLYEKYEKLIGTVFQKNKKEIIDIEIHRPILKKGDWKVYMCFKSWNPLDPPKTVLFKRYSDSSLNELIK